MSAMPLYEVWVDNFRRGTLLEPMKAARIAVEASWLRYVARGRPVQWEVRLPAGFGGAMTSRTLLSGCAGYEGDKKPGSVGSAPGQTSRKDA
jgi:hypothetical protein